MAAAEPLLGKALWQHLANDSVAVFRQKYRKFRLGEAGGSLSAPHSHELFAKDSATPKATTPKAGPEVFEIEDEHSLAPHEEMMEEVQALVNEFRTSYRRFRQGKPIRSRGTMRRLQAKLSEPNSPHIQLLPAARLLRARRQQRQWLRTRSQSQLPKSSFHVHFGAGRLGLGLVVPAICSSEIPFALVNPPFSEFDGFVAKHAGKEARLVVNGEVIGPTLRVVTEVSHLPEQEESLLVISDDDALIMPLLRRATTYSTSVGPGMPSTAKTLIEALPSAEKPSVALFACENDHAGVERLRESLDGRVLVSSCMVDRICVSRALVDDCSPAELRVTTEPYTGCLMVRPLPADCPEVPFPFQGNAVLQPNTMAQADYLERRKLVTVNGMHTTLAFTSLANYCRKEQTRIELKDDKLQPPFNDLPLQTMATLDKDAQLDMLAWSAARQLFLVFEFGEDFVMLAHNIPIELTLDERQTKLAEVMWDYAFSIVHRFSSASDTCGRVLGGGAENRWRTRLKPVDSFLRENKSLGGMAGKLAAKAGVKVSHMRSCIASLCDESEALIQGPMATEALNRMEFAH